MQTLTPWRRLARRPLPLAVALASLAGCRSTNPIGFWDLVELEVVGDSGEQLQGDVGTMEWDERDGLHVVFRYVPGVPGQPLKTDGVYPDEDGAIAEDWLTPTSPPLVEHGSAYSNKEFSVFVGALSTGTATMTDYSGSAMSFEALDARIDSNPVELYFSLER